MNLSDIKVSVCVISYNQQKFIRDCLNGILSQQTNFKYEILIHDDASTDGTSEIIKEYRDLYPDLIKPIIQSENQYSKGVRGMFAKYNYPRATGKYIALCEGDDYWTDPFKLQKQFDFMEIHDDVSMTFHDALVLNVDGVEIPECESRYKKDQYALFTDLIIEGGWFCPTASLFFRSIYVQEGYPDFCLRCYIGDYPLQLYLGTQGKVYYFSDKMSVYRYKIPGSWTASFNLSVQDVISSQQIANWKSELDMLDGINRQTNFDYHNVILLKKTIYILKYVLIFHIKDSKLIASELDIYIRQLNLLDRIFIVLIKCFNFNLLVIPFLYLFRIRIKFLSLINIV